LVEGRPAALELGTRIIVVRIHYAGDSRLVGLQAEDVSELIELGPTTPGLRSSEHAWLGDHLTQAAGLPQLVDPAELLPEALTKLFLAKAET